MCFFREVDKNSEDEAGSSEKAAIIEEDENDELTEYDLEHYDDEDEGRLELSEIYVKTCIVSVSAGLFQTSY